MIKVNKSWIVGFISVVLALCSLFFLPDSVPVHYDLAGNIDSWGSKYTNLIFPALIIVLIIVFSLMQYLSNKSSSEAKKMDKTEAYKKTNARVINIISIVVSCLFLVIQVCTFINQIIIANNVGSLMISSKSIISVTFASLGLLLIIVGNYLPKTKMNGVAGVRTKWSMYNDNTWSKSNFIGGAILIIVGVISIVLSIILNSIVLVGCVLSLILVAAAVISICSYVIYKDELRKSN